MFEEEPVTAKRESIGKEDPLSMETKPYPKVNVHRHTTGDPKQLEGLAGSTTQPLNGSVSQEKISDQRDERPSKRDDRTLPSPGTQRLLRSLIFPLKLLIRFWRFSRSLFILAILTLLVAGGILEFVQLNRPEHALLQVDTATGSAQWKHVISAPEQTLLADARGSIVVTSVGKKLHRLAAYDNTGTLRWTSFPSEGTFSILQTVTRPGTLLVALSGTRSSNATDVTNHSTQQLPLYLLDRSTGHIIWQRTIVSSNAQRAGIVLGSDQNLIYVANIAEGSGSTTIGPTALLLAVNQTTGNIQWITSGPSASIGSAPDFGDLLLVGQQTIWQVQETVYAIDASNGKVAWHNFITDDSQLAPSGTSTAHMAETAGVLLVERSSTYHALDIKTGKERWNIPNPAIGSTEFQGGIFVAGDTFLLYGDGVLEAIRATDEQYLWSQKQLGTIQSAHISGDGSLLYLIVDNSIDGSSPTQVLAALETRSGTVHWTFEPFDQESFVHLQTDGLQYVHNRLYVSLCLPDAQVECHRERLYALNGGTGDVLWKIEASSFSNVQISLDGNSVLFQSISSQWINLVGLFRT